MVGLLIFLALMMMVQSLIQWACILNTLNEITRLMKEEDRVDG